MNFHIFKNFRKKLNCKKTQRSILFGFLLILFIINLAYLNSSYLRKDKESNELWNIGNYSKQLASNANGKSLLINQYANITKSNSLTTFPSNISYTLSQGWTSKNTTIKFEGISKKKDWVYNGDVFTNKSGWTYEEDDSNNRFSENVFVDWEGNPPGCLQMQIAQGNYYKGDKAYYYQNITIPESFSSKTATFSFNYKYSGNLLYPTNGSIYMAIINNGIEKNYTINFQNIVLDQWRTATLQYNPTFYGHTLPGNITIRVGVSINADCSKGGGGSDFYLDTIKFEPWTAPNEASLIKVYDVEFDQENSYVNSSYGKGYTFIDGQRSYNSTKDVIFTVIINFSDYIDFSINSINIIASGIKTFNSTVMGITGSLYTLGDNIKWQLEFSLSIPTDYLCWIEIEKPNDWSFTSILDGYQVEQIESCLGTNYGSTNLKIPSSILDSGIWKLEAESLNYLSSAYFSVWKNGKFENASQLTFSDVFIINTTLSNLVSFEGSYINFTIFYPNGTVFIHQSKELMSYNVIFGNFSVGYNMTVGEYQINIEWFNNISSRSINKVGYKQLNFILWHRTNLTAINSYFEIIAGDPLLLRVRFIDYNLNESIHFASVTYNSSYGISGTMAYIGSGIYFIDLDTNLLPLGEYYFSINASKLYYENQTAINLIILKIIAQPLTLQVPHKTIQANANSIASCDVNVTGSISKTLIWPANVTTDWFNSYNITDHSNGTFTLEFSTNDLPIHGVIESYTISIFANKTGHGTTMEFITLLVHPISTIVNANASFISVNQNDIISIKVNYSTELSNELIDDANCSVIWEKSYLKTLISDGYEIKLFTNNLPADYYTALIKFERAGYETAYKSISVIINEQEVELTVLVNSIDIYENSLIDVYFQQKVNISVRVFAIIDSMYLSGGIITWISDNFEENLTETTFTNFTSSIILDGAYFNPGINTIFLRFQQANYTTKIFPFQLFIRSQKINISAQINFQDISENHLLQISYNRVFHFSCRAYADIDAKFLSGGTITFHNGDFEINLTETTNYWFNISIPISTSIFSMGPNYAYLVFQQKNYTSTTFSLQVFVNQIEFDVNTVGFEGSIGGKPGEEIIIKLNLTEINTLNYVENATLYYSWNFDSGFFEEIGNGIYQLKLRLPSGFEGNHNFKIVVSKEGMIYKTKEIFFIIEIEKTNLPNTLFWVIIFSLIAISTILGSLSLRSYVILPRKRKKQAKLLEKVQVYKDVENIHLVILIQRMSGIPVYSEELKSFRDEKSDGFLISGFIQAITGFSETLIKKEFNKVKKLNPDKEYLQHIIDLDFKYFQLLVCDYGSIRTLLILKENGSERLKKQIYLLTLTLDSEFGEEFEKFLGNLNHCEDNIRNLIYKFLSLDYGREFEVSPNKDYLSSVSKSSELNKMERRILNVIFSMTKSNKQFFLRNVIDQISEKNEDLILEAIDSLIKKKLIISTYESNLNPKKQS